MRTLDLILLVIACVCFLLATFNVAAKVNLVAAGLLAWVHVGTIALAQTF